MKKESWNDSMLNANSVSSLNLTLNESQIELLSRYESLFKERNSQLNLISKNDEKYLFEKHIFDSLAFNLIEKSEGTLLDIGTGGGFPSVILAMIYPNLKIDAIDSIKKKVNAIEHFKTELGLTNLNPICDRVENINTKYDFVVSRAVTSLDKLLELSIPKVKKGGYLIAYKSKKYLEELQQAQSVIKKYSLSTPQIISYKLPLEEVYERYLVIFKL